VRVLGHSDIRHRDLRVQLDAGSGLAGGHGEVKPADLVRRVRAQHQSARCMPAAPADLVADAPVICCGQRAEGLTGHDEPRAGRGLYVGDKKQVAAEVVVRDLDHLTYRHYPPRCSLGCRSGAPRAEAGGKEPTPCRDAKVEPYSDGQADVGLDLIRNVGAHSARGGQRLCDQYEHGGIPPAGNAAHRHLHRAA
jgi:hypothetical protein